MSDVITIANSGEPIKNGSMVTSTHQTGVYDDDDPTINQYVPSGTIVDNLTDRFDDTNYYG